MVGRTFHQSLGEGAQITERHVSELESVLIDPFEGELGSVRAGKQLPDFEVHADPDHVQRILANYLTNAIKYGEPPIDVRLGSVHGFIEVRVVDRGPGVPVDFEPRLFGKFSRAEGTATAGRTGTGLGLSIVRGLALANGGDAWYERNVPRGSCFAVKLPEPH